MKTLNHIMKALFILLPFIVLITACEKDYSSLFPYTAPINIQDGLEVGDLDEVNMDESLLSKATGLIHDGKYGEIHSMLIYKDEKLVFEEYFPGHQYQWDAPGFKGDYVDWDMDMPHCIHSDTKSITSLCIGIAIDKGFIESVQQSIFDYLPDYQQFKINDKEYITIEHLLTMNSGLLWEEWDIALSSIENDQIGIWFWEDGPMDYVLRREFVAEPGTRFNYSGGDIQILAEILKNATGMPLDEFSEKYMFDPLGITSFDWWLVFDTGEIQAAGGLKLAPRDMIKIGAMMLNNGIWNETRIISEEWISKCKDHHPGNTDIKIPGEDLGRVGYSYTWWTKDFSYNDENISMYFAVGWGGQKIIVMPALDMVFSFTGANYTSKVHDFEIIEKFILPSISQNPQ